MDALHLHQALVDAGMPAGSTGAAKAFLASLCSRLGLRSSGHGLKQQFFALLTHLLGKAPSLASSWLADWLAFSATLVSSDPEEAYVLQPQSVLAWAQQAAAGLRERVGAFLHSGLSARVDAVLELQQTAQALLSVVTAVQAVSSGSSDEAQQLVNSLTQLQQATKVLQVLEQLQQQQLSSPGRPPAQHAAGHGSTPATTNAPNGTPARSSTTNTASSAGFGQQPLFRPKNAATSAWQQQLQQRRGAAPEGRLFLDELLHHLQRGARLPAGSAALGYPYADVLTCIDALFVSGAGAGSSSGSTGAWHAKLAVLLYYLLDGGWLGSAEPFAQGFQLPLTVVQQWQCHHLLDAAAGSPGVAANSSTPAAAASAALDKACQLLGAIACPTTPFRFVEALLRAGRPATALAVQRARCSGGSSGSSSGGSSLSEAEVLLRVQLGCGLLPEAFCDLRRHCDQVPAHERPQHTNALLRQLTAWALTPVAPCSSSSSSSGGAGAATHMQQQLRLQEQPVAAAAAAAGAAVDAGAGHERQQQLLQLPLNAGEEGVLLAVLRERMGSGKTGGHLLPLYLLQRGRTLEALSAYADYRASPAAAGAGSSGSSSGAGQATDATSSASAEGQAAASRAMLHKRLNAIMSAAAAALPPALQAAATAPGGVSSSGGGGGGVRSVLQGLGGSEARRLQGSQGGAILLEQRGVEPPAFLAPLLYADDGEGGGSAAAGTGTGAGVATPAYGATAGVKRAGVFSSGAAAVQSVGGTAGRDAAAAGAGAATPAGGGMDSVVRPLLFEEDILAEAGPGTVRLGGGGGAGGGEDDVGKGAGGAADAGDVIPLLFGTPAAGGLVGAAAAAGGGGGGKTPGVVVRGGLFDTPVAAGAGGGGLWGGKTPGAGVGCGGGGGFEGWSEADFERQVRFATPQPKSGAAGAVVGGVAGVFTHAGQRSHKRLRKTPR